MKMPKTLNTFCPFCKKHTKHEIEKVKKGRPSGMSKIERQKRASYGIGNRGKFSKVPGGDKPTKRVALKYRCTACKKAHLRSGFRVSRFELVEA